MEWILSLILQLVSAADGLSHVIMNKPLTAVIQEQIVCSKYFEHHEEEFQGAMRIERTTRRTYVLDSLSVQALAKCGVWQ